jgi:hypothetical protein
MKGSYFMDKTEEINVKLYEKLSKEFNDFCDKLKTLSPEEIIRSSYEKVFKEDILMCFECSDMGYEKAKALLRLDKPLDDLYNEWIGADCSYMDMLRDCIDDRANEAVREMKTNNKAMER